MSHLSTTLCSRRIRVSLFWQPHRIWQSHTDVLGNSWCFKRHWKAYLGDWISSQIAPYEQLRFWPNSNCNPNKGVISNKKKYELQCEMLGRHHLRTGHPDVQIRCFYTFCNVRKLTESNSIIKNYPHLQYLCRFFCHICDTVTTH